MARRLKLSAEEIELCLPCPTPPHEVWVRPIDTYLRRINYRGERLDEDEESVRLPAEPRHMIGRGRDFI
jgi:hypothetical protein